MLPPGPHMVSYNSASRTGEFAPTISFFTFLEQSQVLVRRWDAEQELLTDLQPDEVFHTKLTTSISKTCILRVGSALDTSTMHRLKHLGCNAG